MRILTENDIEKYNEFLKSHDRCNFQQSMEWTKVKSNWKNEVILAEDENGNIIGSLMILIRKIPIFGTLMYSSRGPICNIHNENALQQITEGVNKIAKKYNAFIFKNEPDVKIDDKEYRDIVTKLGYKIKDNAKDFKDEIQPRFVFRLNIKNKTEDEVFNNFHSKTRYNIRLSKKKGVEIKEGTRKDLKDFHKIMVETGLRDKFMIRPLEYFEKMYDVFAPNNLKLMMAYYEGQPIAGILNIIYGNKTWYLYGASSNSYRNLMPNYLLQWEMIKETVERKAEIYDFRGVSGIVDETHPQYGLYRFKKGFGAEFTEFIGEVYITFKPLTYKLYKISERLYKNIIMFKMKLQKRV